MISKQDNAEAAAGGKARASLLAAALLATSALAAPAFAQSAAQSAPAEETGAAASVDEVIVTATARPEARSRVAGTVQVVNQATIERSGAQSITDLLTQNSVGFFNQWTPGQTQINIRGGATDGQGRDFKSQVLVLVNGRRAGTANLSKFSAFDTSRIEVVRGPSSVAYGSQNIGGVINIITKTGLTNPGAEVQLTGGSWGLATATASIGGALGPFDLYVGVTSGDQGDYHAGKGGGKEVNSGWKRRGVSGELGYSFAGDQRLALSFRSDGVYDAGFRGSAANAVNRDDRYNNSADLTYAGGFWNDRLNLSEHLYYAQDVDNLKWASPVVRASNGSPAAGTSSDHNRRRVTVEGSQFRPQATLWTGNNLLAGWDWERSVVRSTRVRVGVGGAAISQIAPYDNNQTEKVNAFYFEDSQNLLDDRLVLRGGLRYTKGKTRFDPTPNLSGVLQTTRSYDATTYSVGATFKATSDLNLRVGAASGFRAPNATELAANFTALGGGQTYGNPDLKPERSKQIEVGATYAKRSWSLDAAVFRNVISDRVITLLRPGLVNVSDYINNPNDVVVEGVELQATASLLPLFGADSASWFWTVSGSGNYNFKMKDKGAAASANTRNVQRVYRSQASFTTRFGQQAGAHPWSGQLQAVYSGPVYYDTEENLLIPFAEPASNFIHRVDTYWLVNARAEVSLTASVLGFVAVNNVFDKNYNPLLIGIDKKPYVLDPRFLNGGGLGTSAPGRSFQAGVKLSFN